MLFLLSGDFIFKINIFEKFFQEYHESQTDITYCRPGLGSIRLQRLSADSTSSQRLNICC